MTERKDRNFLISASKAVQAAWNESTTSVLSIRIHVISEPGRKDWYNDPTIKGIHEKMRAAVNRGWVNPTTQTESPVTEAAQNCNFKAQIQEVSAMRKFWNQQTGVIVDQLRRTKSGAMPAGLTVADRSP